MFGIVFLLFFLGSGVWVAHRLFSKCPVVHTIWLGAAIGMAQAMWLPSLFAFLMDFTRNAQLCAMGLSLLIDLALPAMPGKDLLKCKKVPLKALIPVLPAAALSLYLLHTHTLLEDGGALYVGQSTYGDLCLHLSIATGLKGAHFPPEYTILSGTTLGYPFLTDALSASMLVLGSSLRAAFILPQFVQMLIIYTGVIVVAWDWTEDTRCAVTAFVLLLFNGGLGFLYIKDPQALEETFYAFYRAPANQPDRNLYWANLLCDLFVPQRTLTAGWSMLLPALFLLRSAMRTRDRRLFAALGVWAGFMPMVHTHSFLALGLLSAGAMAYSVAKSRDRGKTLADFACYGIPAVLLALPQLLLWTFPQTIAGGSLKLWFNWVNNSGDGLTENYFVFWIKNVGLVYLLMIPAFFTQDKEGKALAVGAAVIYAVAETVLFQPNHYDNNKLFYVAFLVMLPACAKLLFAGYDRIRVKGVRVILLTVFLCVSMLSGGLSMARECISGYQIFSPDEVSAARFLSQEEDTGMVLTAFQHNNAPAALAGRRIICGSPSYLFYHGVDYSRQKQDVAAMYEYPAENRHLFDEYGVTEVYIGYNELATFACNLDYFRQNAQIVFTSREVLIYRLL